jgi:hypothetical protein
MTYYTRDLPAGCSLADIDALFQEETALVAYATDPYRAAMVERLDHTLDDRVCVQIAASELASHGYPSAAAWAVRDWLDAFECEMALRHVTELMEK